MVYLTGVVEVSYTVITNSISLSRLWTMATALKRTVFKKINM